MRGDWRGGLLLHAGDKAEKLVHRLQLKRCEPVRVK